MDGQINFSRTIFKYLEEEDNESLKQILQRTMQLCHAVDASGATILHYSVQFDNYVISRFLVENYCDVDAQDSLGNSPLMYAVANNNLRIVEILLGAGADISLLNCENMSALHMLECDDNQETYFSICNLCLLEFRRKCLTSDEAAERLIEAGIDLYLAAFAQDSKIIEHMLERGCPVESRHPVRKVTAMHVAVRFDDLDSVRVLLRHGADAHALDADNANPLRYVYWKNYEHNDNKIEILKILFARGVSATSCCSKGRFNINSTLAYGSREAIRVALDSRLDFTATDQWNGCSVLYYLTINPNPGVVQELEQLDESQVRAIVQNASLDVDEKDRAKSVLLLAAAFGNVDMLRFLLSRGVDPNNEVLIGASYYGSNRVRPFFQKQYDQCVELLLQYNADPQFVIFVADEQVTTVFDIPLNTNYFKRMKPIVAHLSLLEKSGQTLTDLIRGRIDADSTLKQYFVECRQLLGERIFGSVTLFTLLTCSRSTMERYSNNTKLLKEIKRLYKRQSMRAYHTYLYNTLQKRLSDAREYKQIKNQVVGAVCKIININKNELIVENIINYLDDRTIWQLTRL